jgi:putative ABC transport system permease protein
MFTKMLLSSLVRRKSRMTVAMLAIAIGGTVLFGMAAISFDIPRQMGREFRSYGANMVLVASGSDAMIRLEDAAAAAQVIPADTLIGMTAYRYETVRVNMRGYTAAGVVFEEARKTSPYWNVRGSWPGGENEILIGSDVAESTRFAPGSKITVTGLSASGARFSREMTISGVLRTGDAEDEFIFMNLRTMESLMGDSGVAAVVEVSVAASESELASLVSEISSRVPGVFPRLVKRVTQSETAVLAKLQALVFLVSLVVLLLTMICVATTMMTVVMERRKEIGLKKAIGAGNGSIVAEFLGEGLVLGIAGGFLGAILGYFFAQVVSVNVFGRGVSLDFKLLPLTVLVSVGVTIVACLIPVRGATEVQPALVLRGE